MVLKIGQRFTAAAVTEQRQFELRMHPRVKFSCHLSPPCFRADAKRSNAEWAIEKANNAPRLSRAAVSDPPAKAALMVICQ